MRTIYAGTHTPCTTCHTPGEALREDMLPALGLTAVSLAKRLDCPPGLLSAVMLCRTSISHDLAVQLEFAGLGRASLWLAQQAAYHPWQAQQKSPQE